MFDVARVGRFFAFALDAISLTSSTQNRAIYRRQKHTHTPTLVVDESFLSLFINIIHDFRSFFARVDKIFIRVRTCMFVFQRRRRRRRREEKEKGQQKLVCRQLKQQICFFQRKFRRKFV